MWRFGGRTNRGRQQLALAVALGLVALGVSLWQLSLPEMPSFYDAGVYVGAALHLVNGTVPYRDFTLVEPPGIVLILSPLALLSHVVGDHGVLLGARTMSAVVSGVNVALLSWLVRVRGRVVMIVAGLAFSSLPVAAYVVTSVKLESYCVLFTLIAMILLFARTDPEAVVTRRRAVVAGALLGAAMLVKFVSFFPLVAILVIVAMRSRRRATEIAAAAVATFVAVCAPFFASSPRNFISQVFFDQVIRQGNQSQSASLLLRLKLLTGFGYSAYQPTDVVTVVVIAIVGVLFVVAALRRSRSTPLDDVVTLTAVLLSVGLMIPSHTSTYYFYESAPFLVGGVVLSAARLVPANLIARARRKVSGTVTQFVRIATCVAAVGLTFGAILWSTTLNQAEAWAFGIRTSLPSALESQIPAGACAIYSQIYDAESANRFIADGSRCPPVTDTFGLWLAWGERWSHPPEGFAAQWRTYFSHASYAVLSYGSSSNVPWTPSLRRWFAAHYSLAYTDPGFQVFRRNGAGSPT